MRSRTSALRASVSDTAMVTVMLPYAGQFSQAGVIRWRVQPDVVGSWGPSWPLLASSRLAALVPAPSSMTLTTSDHEWTAGAGFDARLRSEEHTSELQSRLHLVCRLLLEKKKEIEC